MRCPERTRFLCHFFCFQMIFFVVGAFCLDRPAPLRGACFDLPPLSSWALFACAFFGIFVLFDGARSRRTGHCHNLLRTKASAALQQRDERARKRTRPKHDSAKCATPSFIGLVKKNDCSLCFFGRACRCQRAGGAGVPIDGEKRRGTHAFLRQDGNNDSARVVSGAPVFCRLKGHEEIVCLFFVCLPSAPARQKGKKRGLSGGCSACNDVATWPQQTHRKVTLLLIHQWHSLAAYRRARPQRPALPWRLPSRARHRGP